MSNKDVEIMENIYSENDRIAERIQKSLHEQGIYAINVMGAPGVGKTSSLIKLIKGLNGVKAYVIEGDIESDIDTKKLKALDIETVQINTGGACHLDGILIENTLNDLGLNEPGVLFIENIGNLVCPAEFNIGENCKMLITTVAEGDDKPYKYPLAFEKAAIILLNKIDLLPYLDFDMDYYIRGIRVLNPNAPIIKVSAKTGAGFDEVCEWIQSRM
ncbi:MAG: hydrogenase nickel incorporation protein HypB [Bacillota bacterium]|nr:hydrogenase nickel incorporation protein HypB [Bacillota bacterium]